MRRLTALHSWLRTALRLHSRQLCSRTKLCEFRTEPQLVSRSFHHLSPSVVNVMHSGRCASSLRKAALHGSRRGFLDVQPTVLPPCRSRPRWWPLGSRQTAPPLHAVPWALRWRSCPATPTSEQPAENGGRHTHGGDKGGGRKALCLRSRPRLRRTDE